MKHWIYAGALAFGLLSCNSEKQNDKPDVVASNLDTTVRPNDDFFLYANGGWIKRNPIPDEESAWGIGNLVVEENLKRLRTIAEKAAAAKATAGSADQKIGDFWAMGMDSAKIEQDGLKPLQGYFQQIESIQNHDGLVQVAANFDKIGIDGFMGFYVSQDAKNSSLNALQFWQSGLGLPEREYYFKTDSTTVAIRAAYQANISKILVMSGFDQAKADKAAQDILVLETNLAKSHRKLEDLRDPYANYNKMAVADLNKLAPKTNWTLYLSTSGIPKTDSIIVGQPEYIQAMETALHSGSMEVWKHMLRYRTIARFSEQLPNAYGQTFFDFNKLFSGAKQRRPRWKRVLRSQENAMGELLGQLYVKEFFNEKAKKRYEDMVESVKAAYKARIEKLDWMGDSTKQKALVKLASVKKKVGYPDKWKDFTSLQIGRESYAANVASAAAWWYQYRMSKLGKPVDRDEWEMTPQTYNAYYNPSNNEIVLPAGIFTVPGYRDEEVDDATAFGYAGASTIGHEITHGFDDQGRQFDAEGNLKSWWTANDEKLFNQKADVMVRQFSAIEPVPGMFINGKATLGENIADLGGILIGLDAFKQTEQFKKNEKKAGLTPLQRYFLGYALGWLGHIREASLKNQLMTDVHSPAKYRVNGTFVSVPEFYEAFGIKAGDKMYLSDTARVRIW